MLFISLPTLLAMLNTAINLAILILDFLKTLKSLLDITTKIYVFICASNLAVAVAII
jgi:hypothetical protein